MTRRMEKKTTILSRVRGLAMPASLLLLQRWREEQLRKHVEACGTAPEKRRKKRRRRQALVVQESCPPVAKEI
jgi:hypothetical protein